MGVESWYLWKENQFFESLQETLWYPLNIQTPTPAPDRSGPVACRGGRYFFPISLSKFAGLSEKHVSMWV